MARKLYHVQVVTDFYYFSEDYPTESDLIRCAEQELRQNNCDVLSAPVDKNILGWDLTHDRVHGPDPVTVGTAIVEVEAGK